MESGMIKMIIKVTVIAIILLTVSLFLAAHYGGIMMKISTSEQTKQENGTGTPDSASPINQNQK